MVTIGAGMSKHFDLTQTDTHTQTYTKAIIYKTSKTRGIPRTIKGFWKVYGWWSFEFVEG